MCCLIILFIILSSLIKLLDEFRDFDKILKHQVLIILYTINIFLQVLDQVHHDVRVSVPIVEAADPLHSLLEGEHLGAKVPESIDGVVGSLLPLNLCVPVLVGARKDIRCIGF
jgi:hypothetical protein